jgi:hypothetical protein
LTDVKPFCVQVQESKLFETFVTGNILEWSVTHGKDSLPKAYSSSYTFVPTEKGFYDFTLKQSILFSDVNVQYFKTCYGPDLTFTQEVRAVPVVDVTGDSLVCENTTKVKYQIIKPEDSLHVFEWSVTGNRVNYSPSASKYKELYRQVDWTVPGFDTIRVSEDNGACKGYDSLIVRVSQHAQPNFVWEIPGSSRNVEFRNTTDKPIIEDAGVIDTVQFLNFKWNFGRENDKLYTQSNLSYESDSIIRQKYKYGYYDVTLRSFNEYCTDSIVKKIFVDMQEGLYVPNSFIPESKSPTLSHFQPKGFNVDTYKIWVYDTWGNLLWYSDKLLNGSPSEGWDGTYEGTVLKMDSYIWKIEATFMDGTAWEGQANSMTDKKKTMGNVLLMR